MTQLGVLEEETGLDPARGAADPLDGARAIWSHDRWWSERGFLVVRPGSTLGGDDGERTFMLLDEDVCVDCEAAALRRVARGAGVHPFVCGSGGWDARQDCVVSDGTGRLVAIRRDFNSSAGGKKGQWITRDPAIAARWAYADAEPAGAWLEGAVDELDRWDVTRILGASMRAGEWSARLVGMGSDREPGGIEVKPSVWSGRRRAVGLGVRRGHAMGLPDLADAVGSADRSREIGLAVKRAFDIAVGSAALLLASPIGLLIALAILISDGRPVFFHDVRQTKGGRRFRCWKFRTMRRDAAQMQGSLSDQNQCGGPHFFVRRDPRAIGIGRILRRCHLDELPQLFNVLAGDMSIVGPRPSPSCENQFCPTWRETRLSMRAGLTGLWQVRRVRRPDTDFQEWIRYDMEYVERWSLGLDAGILLRTPIVIVSRALGLSRCARLDNRVEDRGDS